MVEAALVPREAVPVRSLRRPTGKGSQGARRGYHCSGEPVSVWNGPLAFPPLTVVEHARRAGVRR